MVKKLFTLFLLSAFCLTAFAGERVLVRIGEGGKQEAIPLKKGESARAAIERMENQRASLYKASNSAGLKDTLKYFATNADLTTNFGWTHQDLAFQWYVPQAKGTVKEFWWLNYLNRGVLNKGTVRAWHIDPRVANFPASPNTKFIGAFKDATDGDGGVQPFKPATGNQWFYSNGAADSVTYSFNMFTKEAAWLQGGLQVTLDSNKWQGIKLEDWGDSMNVALGELFGFTLTNDTKKSDFGAGTDTRLEILSAVSAGAPYHSYKYYETGRTAASNAGWHMRGDYEWGMYVVIEYTGDRAPKVTVGAYGTTLNTAPRAIAATVTDDNPGGGAAGVASARVFSKIGRNAAYDSVAMTNTGSAYTGNAKGGVAGDTIYWYVGATDVAGNRTVTPARSYVLYKKTKPFLFIYNNALFSRGNANLIYHNDSRFDYWSSPSDGTGELPTLLALYNDILVADGSFPARNVYPALKGRLDAATTTNQVAVFFNSQDYGCYIQSACADTTFSAGSLELDYFGVSKIGTQDLPPTNREFRIIPQADTVTNYLINWGTSKNSTLWYDPTFELGFAGYQDAITMRAEAKALFKDGGTNVVGGKYITTKTRAMFASFDIGALQFRSDTAKTVAQDSVAYAWVPTDVGSVAAAFFNAHKVTSVQPFSGIVPGEFQLGQNYPNPFNPSTTIEYKVPVRSNVEIAIFNILGQKVATVINDMHEAGSHRATWNGRDLSGKLASSGVYFYSLKAGSFEQVKKMMLMK